MTSTKLRTTNHLNYLFSKTNYHPIKIVHTKISLQLWDFSEVLVDKNLLSLQILLYQITTCTCGLIHLLSHFTNLCGPINYETHVNNCVRILSSISLIQHFISAKFEENWSGIYDFRPCLKHFIYTFSNTKKSIWLMTTLNYFQQRKVIT